MTIRAAFMKIVQQDDLNFLLTNAFPRRLATRAMGWFSRIEHPVVYFISFRVWSFFSTVDLGDARETRFRSMHHCFTRQLKDGARPIDATPQLAVCPCDGIVGACGHVEAGQVMQVKGLLYPLAELLGDEAHAETFSDGCYVTLRLTAGMYHWFHAPHDCRVDAVTHVFGDTWNVNPATLRRVDRLFCKNERAIVRTTLTGSGQPVTLVAVAAILVAGIRLRFLEMPVGAERRVRRTYACAETLGKGEPMGWFEHGSTILVFAPRGFTLCDKVREGAEVRVGQPLFRVPD